MGRPPHPLKTGSQSVETLFPSLPKRGQGVWGPSLAPQKGDQSVETPSQPPKKGSECGNPFPAPQKGVRVWRFPPQIAPLPDPPGPVAQQGHGGGVGVRQPPRAEPALPPGQVGQELQGVSAGGDPVELAQLWGDTAGFGGEKDTQGIVTLPPFCGQIGVKMLKSRGGSP